MPRSPHGPAARVLALLATLLALAGVACGPLAPGRLEARRVIPPREVAGVALPEVDSTGAPRPYTFRARPGGVLIVYFGYASCPDVCPTTLATVRQALDLVGTDARRVDFAFVTVDPVRDSAAVLVPYVRTFFPAGHALRPADQASLGGAERAFNAASTVTRAPGGEVRVSHTPFLYAVDAEGRMGYEWAFGVTPARLAADLRTLLRSRGGS